MRELIKQGRIPSGFLGMLVIVAAVEIFVANRPIWFSRVSSLNRVYSMESATDRAPGHDILFLGDSLVKLGLLPAVVEPRCGRTAINLAAASGPATSTYNVFRRALASGANPEAIVIDFGPGLLAGDPEKDVRNSSEVLSTTEFLDLAATSRSVPLLTSLAIRRVMPSVRRRVEIRDALMAIWEGKPFRQAAINLACRRNWNVNNGAHVAAPSERTDEGPEASDDASSRAGELHVHRVNRTYADRIFTLAQMRGIRVFWLLPPESPRSRSTARRKGLESSYTGFVREMRRRHPEITILDARDSGYDQTVFFDAVHLDVRGAVALSTTVGDQLAASLNEAKPRSQWIALPHPEPIHKGPLPEDFEQSKLALGLSVPTLETDRVTR